MQIRTKLTISFIFMTASLLLVAFVSIYIISARNRETSLINFLKKKAVTRADLLIKINKIDIAVLKIIDRYKKDVFPYEKIAIYNQEYKQIYTNNDSINLQIFIPDLKKECRKIKQFGEFRLVSQDMEIICLPYTYKNKFYYLFAGAKDLHGKNSLSSLRKTLVFVYIVFLSFLGYFGWIYAKRALKPISVVMNQVDRISGANLHDRLDIGPNQDEITRLTQTFNLLLDRVEKAFDVQRNFVSNASHELRNPLTAITTQLEVTLLSDRSTENYKETLSSILEDIKNLSEISSQLLILSRLQEGDKLPLRNKIRIDELLWDVRSDYLVKNPQTAVIFVPNDLPESENMLFVYGNDALLKTCFSNLIDNGVKFSLERKVDIDLSFLNDKLTVSFTNKGLGISKFDLEHIFEPFYRSEQSTAIRGSGIGLSIVKSIVKLHNAELLVESVENKFTRFSITFTIKTF